jgi:hypothetical protein
MNIEPAATIAGVASATTAPSLDSRPPQPSAYARWEWITPKVAEQLLARASRQRRIVPALVRHYARQMPDAWLANPELVMVNRSGETIEGQHRLLAVISSGASVWMFVARDVEDSVFSVLNTGRARGPRDAISIMYRDADPVALAAAIPMLAAYDRGAERLTSFGKLTPSEHLQLLDRHPGLALCSGHSKEIVRLLGKGSATFVRFLLSEINQEAAEDFFRRLESGDGDRGTGVRELRERLGALGNVTKPQIYRAALAIKAWNIERLGRTTSQPALRWRTKEVFPKPISTATAVL